MKNRTESKSWLLRVHVFVDPRSLPPVDDGVAELAEQQRVFDDGEIIRDLAVDVPNLLRLTHLNLEKQKE